MKNGQVWTEHVDILDKALLGNGAFLMVEDEDKSANPMTIGWASVGRIWSIPTLAVLVRRSRYTYGLLLQQDSFSVSVPRGNDLALALDFCGNNSGRDMDKADRCGISLIPGKKVSAPVVGGCTLYYECRIVLRKQLEENDFCDQGILQNYYKESDHHMLVIGEILAVYTADTN
jgi:flavin reductase (DIM6/NTAB) family NADH-FMN oxidoreductase RutF